MGESKTFSRTSAYREKVKKEAGKKASESKPPLKPHNGPKRRDNGGYVK